MKSEPRHSRLRKKPNRFSWTSSNEICKETYVMFEVTREMFQQEMAEAVFGHLRSFLMAKENNHCQRVEFLPVEVMRMICEKISKDPDLNKHGVEAYVLAEAAGN